MKNDEFMEVARFGCAVKMKISWDGEKVVLTHRGYAIKLFGLFIPLLLTKIIGAGYGAELPIDDNTSDMDVNITLPWLRKMYGYYGRFEVSRLCRCRVMYQALDSLY